MICKRLLFIPLHQARQRSVSMRSQAVFVAIVSLRRVAIQLLSFASTGIDWPEAATCAACYIGSNRFCWAPVRAIFISRTGKVVGDFLPTSPGDDYVLDHIVFDPQARHCVCVGLGCSMRRWRRLPLRERAVLARTDGLMASRFAPGHGATITTAGDWRTRRGFAPATAAHWVRITPENTGYQNHSSLRNFVSVASIANPVSSTQAATPA